MSRKKKAMVKLDDTMTQCLGILKHLQNKPEASPFLEPVDWEFYGLTDYPEIIKNPMDLGTVQDKVESGKCTTMDAFANDVRLVWKNAMRYNRPDSDIYITAEKLSKVFDKKFGKVKKGPSEPDSPSAKRKKPNSAAPASADKSAVVRKEDRVQLSKMIQHLSSDELGELVDRIRKEAPEALNEDDGEEVAIEVNNISASVLLELNTYVSQCVNKKPKKPK